jgi:putative aminopeptidase FrvX
MIEELDFSKIKNSHMKPLDIVTVLKAVGGNDDSIRKIIEHYSPYIKKLATTSIVDKYGNVFHYVDEMMRIEIENKLSQIEIYYLSNSP